MTVGTILGLLASGASRERILQAYPYLEAEDIDAALEYAAWRLWWLPPFGRLKRTWRQAF